MASLEEIYLDCQSVEGNELHCPIETEIALFYFNYIEFNTVKIILLCSEDNLDTCCLPVSIIRELHVDIIVQPVNEFQPKLAICKRPSAKTHEAGIDLFHSGLCNTLRQATKSAHLNNPEKKYDTLLGFNTNFLKACAEVSSWTMFCEISLPSEVQNRLQRKHHHVSKDENMSCSFPKEIVMLNNNFKQPVKIKNIQKTKLKIFKNMKVEERDRLCDVKDIELVHMFAEASATDMSITDLILFPCIHEYLVSEVWLPSAMQKHLNLVYEWYIRMTLVPRVVEVSKLFGFIQPPLDVNDVVCDITIPPVSGEAIRDQNKSKRNPKTKVEDIETILDKLKENNMSSVYCGHLSIDDLMLDWATLPDATHPATGDLPQKRVERKCQQLENMVQAVRSIAKPGDCIVDFCSGGGHVGILLAYFLTECKIVLVENKEESLQRAISRIKILGLKNIEIYQSNLDYYYGDFDIGLCLHACGSATDMVLQKCIKRGASFVICPCCYGSICSTNEIQFPRSNQFAEAGISNQEYMILARGADQTEKNIDRVERGKYCMQMVDTDRSLYAAQFAYEVKLSSMYPLSCSPKNNLLIGTKPA